MRWMFYDPQDTAEARHHEETLDSIGSWWTAFQERRVDLAARLAGELRWDIPSWVRKHLKPIDHNLKWEIAPGDDGRNRFTITPESHRELRPLVDEILIERLQLRSVAFESDSPSTVFGHPVDHAYYRGLRVLERWTEQSETSDHNPLWVAFALEDETLP